MQNALKINIKDQSVSLELPKSLDKSIILLGKSKDEVLRLLPLIFNLCPTAHKAAATLAMGESVGEVANSMLAQEILREHLMVIFRDLPLGFGLEIARDALMGIHNLDITRLEKIENDLFQMPAHGFLTTPHEMGNGAFALTLLEKIGQIETDAIELANDNDPTYYARANAFGDNPFIGAYDDILSRFWARLWEIANLILALKNNVFPPMFGIDNKGAWVWAARGELRHFYEFENGKVSKCQIITPTNRILGEGRTLANALESALKSHDAKAAFALTLSTFDPCIETQIEWGMQNA